MDKKGIIKVIGLLATLVSAGSAILTSIANEKQMDIMIEEKVEKALAEKKTENEEENTDEEES